MGYEYTTETISPSHISLVPILRSGLGMVDGKRAPLLITVTFMIKGRKTTNTSFSPQPALQAVLPTPVPIFHLGLYREKSTLQPVEYYNNLPYHSSSAPMIPPSPLTPTAHTGPSDLAILLDPIIATGATCSAAIDTLRDWGVKKVVVCAVLGSLPGLEKVAGIWSEGVEIWVGGIDAETDGKGMIRPGLGDVGDRLFGTIGK